MQGKGIVKFFLVVMTLVVLMQYFFILPTRKVENNADAYATSFATNKADYNKAYKEAKAGYLDSVGSEVAFTIPLLKEYTYDELKAQQLAYGLDLKGGMSVVMQVDLKDFLEALANKSSDPAFNKSLVEASDNLRSAQADYVTLFADAYSKNANGKKLAPIFARNESFRDVINYETSDAEVIRLVREKANETVELTYKRLKDRIDELGVVQPNVSLDAARDLITVELPGIENPERARKFLSATANLEFWEVFRATDPGVISAFIEADSKLKKMKAGEDPEAVDEPEFREERSVSYVRDSTGTIIDSTVNTVKVPVTTDPYANVGPLFKSLTINQTQGANILMPYAVLGMAEKNKRKEIDEMLAKPQIKSLFPKDMEFRWSQKPSERDPDSQISSKPLYELYGIKKRKGTDKPALGGEMVVDARTSQDPNTGEVGVSLKMNNKGAKIWGELTTRAAQDNNREFAIVLDDRVVSAPSVRQAILSGDSSITGNFDVQEAKDLASILQIGKLPAKTKIIQESLVGPSLGAENISRSIKSMVFGFLLVLLFMLFYYAKAGFVSIIALLMNLFFIFGALASYGTVLTLPGLAGILLTIGMAVDANVIIYERIREELRAGKTTLMAVKDGFQHSYSAIIDANVTTILTALVLAYFGMGPIKGFAVVLIIGVMCSIFTAVLVGRLIIDWYMNRGGEMTFWTNFSKDAFANLKIDWLSKRRTAYMISGTIIVLGIVSMIARGWELGVDFKGGYSYNVQFAQDMDVDIEALRSSVTKSCGNIVPTVKAISTENTYNIVTSYMINEEGDKVANTVLETVFAGVNEAVGGNLALADFKNPDAENAVHVISSSKVGPTIADDIKTSAIYATFFALLFIFAYIAIRFNKWQYSAGAVAALFHDVAVVLGLFSIFHGILPFSLEINQAFIAAILTVIGYSINDTVVVFDRIREFANNYTKKSKHEIINLALNSTVSRTVITSITTLFVVLILFLFGGTSMRGFAFALVVGVIVGTYSSIFIATPIMSDLSGDMKPKKVAEKKSSFSRAKISNSTNV